MSGWGGGTYLPQRNQMPVGRSPHPPFLTLSREAHTALSHAHDQECSLVSEHASLPPAARCDSHHIICYSPLCPLRYANPGFRQLCETDGRHSWLKPPAEEAEGGLTGHLTLTLPEKELFRKVQGPPSFLHLAGVPHWIASEPSHRKGVCPVPSQWLLP